MGYLTPSAIPADSVCRVLFVPNDQEFIANVTGAIQTLTFPEQWVKYGVLTPQQAADALIPMFDDFCLQKGACRVIGEIIAFAGPTSPDPLRWLACDGASLLRADYPDLFTVIGTAYGAVDASHFSLPDLRGRVALRFGTGPGLSTYSLGDAKGDEGVTLTVAETPAHSHTDAGHTHVEATATPSLAESPVVLPIPSAVPGAGVTGTGSANLSSSGGDGAHNNLQPYLAINFLIVALS